MYTELRSSLSSLYSSLAHRGSAKHVLGEGSRACEAFQQSRDQEGLEMRHFHVRESDQ